MSKLISFLVISLSLSSSWAFGATAAPAATGLTVSGFLDVQHQWGRGVVELNANQKMGGQSTGFVVNQGAMVLSDEFESVEMTVDIPFRSSTTTGTTSNELELATEEAQAYLKYQHDSGFYLQLGQFDSYFGLESNDTIDLLFTDHGILRAFNPNTHTGLLVGYSFLPFYIQTMVANANSATRQPDDQSAEFSLRLGWSQEPIQASVGIAYTNTNGTYLLDVPTEVVDYQPRMVLNGVVQGRIGQFEFGAEIDLAQSRLETAHTVSGRKDHEMVMGYLVQGIYNLTSKMGLGIRYEYLRNDETNEFVQAVQNDPSNVGLRTITGQDGYLSKLSFGTRYFLNEELAAKAGVDLYNLNVGTDLPEEGKTQSWLQAAVGMVYDF